MRSYCAGTSMVWVPRCFWSNSRKALASNFAIITLTPPNHTVGSHVVMVVFE